MPTLSEKVKVLGLRKQEKKSYAQVVKTSIKNGFSVCEIMKNTKETPSDYESIYAEHRKHLVGTVKALNVHTYVWGQNIVYQGLDFSYDFK